MVASLLTAATSPLTEQAMASIERASQPNAPATSRRSLLLQQLAPLLPSTPAAEAPAASASEADTSASAPGSSGKGMTASQHQALRDLLVMCLLVVVVFGIKYFFTRGQTFFITKASARLGTDLRLRLFGKLQRLPLRYYNDKRTGSIQSALTNDVNVYANAVGMVRDGIDGPFRAIAALVAIIWMQWQLALLAILFIPVLAWFVNRNGRRMKAAQAVVQDDLSDLNAMANEALQGTRVIKAFAAEQRISDLYSGLVERAFGSQIQAARRFAALRPMVEFIGAVSLAAILYICGWMAAQGMLVVSQIVALTLAMDQINQGARSFANMNNTYNQVTAAAERLQREVLEVEEEPLQSGAMQLASIKGDVEFRNVSFAYPDGTLALRDVNFTIPAGTSLALVGPSGAGKSTIADLLLRFYDPTEGQILLDGTDLRELDLAWLRQQFGV
ncbi:MAG: ABC transporter ATP-binding protein, partial [Armatimonadota bacterium]